MGEGIRIDIVEGLLGLHLSRVIQDILCRGDFCSGGNWTRPLPVSESPTRATRTFSTRPPTVAISEQSCISTYEQLCAMEELEAIVLYRETLYLRPSWLG